MSRIVFFLTDQVASSFEWQELQNLRGSFDKVVLITSDKNALVKEDEKLSVEIVNQDSYSTSRYIGKSIKYLSQFIREYFSNVKNLRHPKLYLIQVSLFLRSIHLSEKIEAIVKKHTGEKDEVLMYAFWFNHWANAIGFLNGKLRQPAFFISRAHGTDLYEERVIGLKRIAFRRFYIKQLDKVFSVSDKGTSYLKKRYPSQASKILTAYLGTVDFGKSELSKSSVFTIVSCAHIRKIKRLHELPKILAYMQHPVRWVHIGEEAKNDNYVNTFRKQVELLKKENAKVEIIFKGDLSNEEVFDFYRNNSIDLFVSVSENEGLPISMMEAISAGIPVLATDVGGCSEIVTATTGILIPKYFEPKNVATKIDQLIENGMGTLSDRNTIRAYWKAHFENNENARTFLSKLGIQQKVELT